MDNDNKKDNEKKIKDEEKKNEKNIIPENNENSKKKVPKKIKSNLKCSKDKLNEMKDKILQIFNDNTDMIQNASIIQDKNDKELNDEIMNSQQNYEDLLDKLYEQKMEKLLEIDDKYNNELFELKDYIDDDTKNKTINGSNLHLKNIYESVKQDKEKEIELVEKDFEKKNKELNEQFAGMSELKEDFSIDYRSIIYRNELFENLKNKINEVENQPNKKKVSILLKKE